MIGIFSFGHRISDGLVPLLLIRGTICLPETKNKISSKFCSYIEIVVEKNNNSYTSIIPEYDGLFILQDINPGKYDLKINYLSSETITLEKEPLSVVVLSGKTGDFYEELDFNVTAIKAKNAIKFLTGFHLEYSLKNSQLKTECILHYLLPVVS